MSSSTRRPLWAADRMKLGDQFKGQDRILVSPGERLRFARQVLLGLATICVGVFVAHGSYPDNACVSQTFELVKIGALPLVTLVVSFYFPNGTTSKE